MSTKQALIQAEVGVLKKKKRTIADLEFLPLQEQDLPALARLHAKIYNHEQVDSAHEQVKLFWAGAYGQLLAPATIGAWEEKTLRGAVIVVANSPFEASVDCATIVELFVHPKYRRRGVASTLVALCAKACKEVGTPIISLRVDMKRAVEAMPLYDYLGFESQEITT